MSRVSWKDGLVLSVELKDGVCVLAQMAFSPYLIFFNNFTKNHEWSNVNLSSESVLFVKAVSRQFIKSTNIVKLPKLVPALDVEIPKYWIEPEPGSRMVTVWPNTPDERSLIVLSEDNSGYLLEISGEYLSGDRTRVRKIGPKDLDVIQSYEIASVGLYPSLNERLFLCYELSQNIAPDRILAFGLELPKECADYVDIVSGKVELSKLGY